MTGNRPNWAPESIDLDQPNAARIYDYLLGGATNFAADRAFAEKLVAVMPQARAAARLNRAFLRRAVRFCASAGIRQFVDLGSGIPTSGNVHEIAPDARVLYVDIDPVAVTHGEALLRDTPRANAMHGDLTQPEPVLASPAIDFSQPVALLLVSVLHFIADDTAPHEAVARYVSALAPGSYLVLSHAVFHEEVTGGDEANRLYQSSNTPGVRRTRAEITQFFDGLDLVPPGLTWTPQWRPDTPDETDEDPAASLVLAGVARKSGLTSGA